MSERIMIGVSACLLGEPVRYDGGHKHDRYITDTLGRFFDFVPVCPEVEAGLGIPREAMHLEGDPDAPRLVTRTTAIDHTERMLEFARQRVRRLEEEHLCGFIFKSKSPSSGLHRIPVHRPGRSPAVGRGLFAAAVVAHFPLLPVEDEGRLHDPKLRENFIERIFAFHRWRAFLAATPDAGGLVRFHTAEKLLVMSHSVQAYRDLGRLVAQAGNLPTESLFSSYGGSFMQALALQATTKKQTNVLQHVMGYFKRDISSDEKAELLEVIDTYRRELVPLIVPITLLRHYVRKFGDAYLSGQTYLNPHPVELMLRNHV